MSGNKPRQIGYNFEKRVQKLLDKISITSRQGASKFPDLFCIAKTSIQYSVKVNKYLTNTFLIPPGAGFLVECKVGKYLSKQETERFKELSKVCPCFVAYRIGRKLRFRLFQKGGYIDCDLGGLK